MAHVTFETAAAEQFQQLPERIKSRVIGIIERLERWPGVSGAKPLGRVWPGITEFEPAITASNFACEATRSFSNASGIATAFTTSEVEP